MSNEQTTKIPLHERSFPICPKCNTSCYEENELVVAFNQVYHDQCFICEDCQIPVTDKYYPLIINNKRLVTCEYHHLKRLGLMCLKCNQPLTTTDNVHPTCIQCPLCVTPTISQYEWKGIGYCRFHYSTLQGTHCYGCEQAILKQFVQHDELPNKIWHPECFMIYKFWTVKLAPLVVDEQQPDRLFEIQKEMETKATRVWTDLSSFEESSANCISDMLLNVAGGAYTEGIRMAKQFIMHLQVLFSALDQIQHVLLLNKQELDCHGEANVVCKQMIRFFELLTVPSSVCITQELLELVTGLAKNLKSLIRIGLEGALHLERHVGIQNATIEYFLNELLKLEKKRVSFKDARVINNNSCQQCHLIIENTDCYQHGGDNNLKWHSTCFTCKNCSIRLNEKTAILDTTEEVYCQSCCCTTTTSNCFTRITLLQQYLFNLEFYLAKLSFSSSSSSPSLSVIQGNKKNEMPESTKRQHSILRILGNRQSTTTTTKRVDSVHLGEIQRIPATTTTNKITNSIRRSLSSATSLSKKRISLYNVFDNNNNTKRASLLDNNNSTTYLSTLSPVQDFIVRHVAVITIQPFIDNFFSLDELIDLIQVGTTTTPLWGKLITRIKSSSNKNKIFGVSLSRLLEKERKQQQGTMTTTPAVVDANFFSNNAFVPNFIKTCIMAIFESDMSIEGVFRKNGNIRQLKLLSASIDNNNNQQQLLLLLSNENSIQLAALLKRYLRELPEPLLTFSLYKLFIQCSNLHEQQQQEEEEEKEEKRKLLHLACCLLPKANRDTMLLVFTCLKWVSTFSDTNKMDIPNLARVIAPNVLYQLSATADHLRQGAKEEINVVENLIRHVDQISMVPSDLILLSLQEEKDMVDINSRYFIQHYIQLLKSQQSTSSTTIIMKSPSSPIPNTINKQRPRRTSWIPGLTKK